MRQITFLILFIFLSARVNAQQEFHVFPENHNKTPGTKTGDGILYNPWDLQTALKQKNTKQFRSIYN